MADIHWYPGHMTHAKREMEKEVSKVDIVIELLDARVPLSSKNPDIEKIASGKKRLILLNKADLADKKATREWISYYESQGLLSIPIDARSALTKKKVIDSIFTICKEKLERDQKRMIQNRSLKAMVVGIPNVGKSTFINLLAGSSAAKTGNMPGVTRGNQWIRLTKDLDLLDTPGILWPKFSDPKTGLRLAYIGSVKEEVLDSVTLAEELLKDLLKDYKDALANRFSLKEEDMEKEDLFSVIARKIGALKKGGLIDSEKTAHRILSDFRAQKFGNITLEKPEEKESL